MGSVSKEEKELRNCIKATAESQLFVREIGSNGGAEIRKYSDSRYERDGEPYCGKFCRWVYKSCGVAHKVKAPALALSWIQHKKRVVWRYGKQIKSQPKPDTGDIAYEKRVYGSGHVEIVDYWTPKKENKYWVVGGNVSDPKNKKIEGVFKKQRYKRKALIVNHITPLTTTKKTHKNNEN